MAASPTGKKMVVKVYTADTWNFKSLMVTEQHTLKDVRDMASSKMKIDAKSHTLYGSSDIKGMTYFDLRSPGLESLEKSQSGDPSFKLVIGAIGVRPSMSYTDYVQKEKERAKQIALKEKSQKKESGQPKKGDDFVPILPGQANALGTGPVGTFHEEGEEERLVSPPPSPSTRTRSGTTGHKNSSPPSVSSSFVSPRQGPTQTPTPQTSTQQTPQSPHPPQATSHTPRHGVEGQGPTYVIALHDSDQWKDNANALLFKKGDIIEVIRPVNDKWSAGRLPNGSIGVFPVPYTRPYPIPQTQGGQGAQGRGVEKREERVVTVVKEEEEEGDEDEEEDRKGRPQGEWKVFLRNRFVNGPSDVEFCTGEHILGKLNKSLFINHPSVDPKQAILEVDEVKRVATLLSCSEVHTLVFRSMGGSAEKETHVVSRSHPFPLQTNDIVVLAKDACEFIVHFKMVKEEELNAIALFSQKNAALDDFAESCKSLLEQEREVFLTEELMNIGKEMPIAISQSLVFQLLSGSKRQLSPQELGEAKKQYALLYQAFLAYQGNCEFKKEELREFVMGVPDGEQILASERFNFLKNNL